MLFQQPFSSLVSSRDLLEVSTVLFASTVWMCRFAVTRSGALFSDHYVPLRCHFLRVSMGWWHLRLSAKILALLRLSANFF